MTTTDQENTMSESSASFERIETACAILREYAAASEAEREGGDPIYEADYARRILALMDDEVQLWADVAARCSADAGRLALLLRPLYPDADRAADDVFVDFVLNNTDDAARQIEKATR